MRNWLHNMSNLRFLVVSPGISVSFLSSSIIPIMNSNMTHVLMCFAGGLLSFLPLLIGLKSNFEDSTLKNSLSSRYYFRDSSMASLALAIPISIDIILDMTTMFAKKRKICAIESQICLNNIEKCVLLIGITSIPLTAFLPYDLPNIGLAFFCCQKFQLVIVAGIVMTSLCRNNKEFWTVSNTIAFHFILGSATSISIFARNASLSNPDDQVRKRLNMACIFFSTAPIVYLIYCNIRWLTEAIRAERKGSARLTGSDRQSDSHIFFTMIWVVTTLIGMILQALINGVYLNVDHFDSKALLMNNLIFLCFELSITVFLMRVVKSDVVLGLYALIDSKKTYVRYISHELRTPLNTAFLGLKLLTEDMAKSNDPKDAERYDTLRDVNLSCKAALDILNDLLCFDKLESGILELHKQDKQVLPFVADCLAMFAAQARDNKIKMTVTNCGCSSEELLKAPYSSLFWDASKRAGRPIRHFSSPPLSQSDSVFIDKFKMDQVIRNLISNALKFTPKGGSIDIKISHLPTIEFTDAKPKIVNLAITKATSFFYNPSSSQIHASEDDIEYGLNSESMISGHLIIEVSDSGAGISAENQKRLFKDIVQFNPEILQAGGGSGLGLWITKGIVDLHNGKISVHSEGEGRGSQFMVGVPMSRRVPLDGFEPVQFNAAINAALYSMKSPPYPSSPDGYLSSNISSCHSLSDCSVLTLHGPLSRHLLLMHERSYVDSQLPTEILSAENADDTAFELLVVDDSRLNRKMLCKILRGAGCLCDEAEDGLQAIEMVKLRMAHTDESKRSYDAILMDYIMPQMDGPTATKRIRALDYRAPIFGVTGNALDSDVDYFIGCGADKVFSKPFDLTDFLDHMRDM